MVGSAEDVLTRSQYGSFEFYIFNGTFPAPNESYANLEGHNYRVCFVDGVPASCDSLSTELPLVQVNTVL